MTAHIESATLGLVTEDELDAAIAAAALVAADRSDEVDADSVARDDILDDRVTGVENDVAQEAIDRAAAISAAVSGLINGAPGLYDTLGELAAGLASDQSAVGTLTAQIAGKQDSSATLTAIAALTTTL